MTRKEKISLLTEIKKGMKSLSDIPNEFRRLDKGDLERMKHLLSLGGGSTEELLSECDRLSQKYGWA